MATRKTTTKKNIDKKEETPEEAKILLGTEAMANEENEVMKAISDMKDVFASKFDGVLSAIQDIKTEIRDFGGRISEAEHRISSAEDSITGMQKTVQTMENQVELLNSRIEDLENRNRRCNLRLVNLPEKAEGNNAVRFLEDWLPNVFETLSSPLTIERAHRIGRLPRHATEQKFPRVLIMKFLNFQDRQRVMGAAREMKVVKYQEHRVMFFPDFSAEVRKQRKQFEGVKKRLQSLNIEYRFGYPAKLIVSCNGHNTICTSPEEVDKLIKAGDTRQRGDNA